MFEIKISWESRCDFERPMIQQMFCVTRIVNLRDPFCDFTQPMLRTCAMRVDVWI